MRIGLIDIDSHAKIKKWGATIYPNLALCKIAAYHKSIGDSVEWYEPLHEGRFDKVYASKIFNFSQDYPYQIDSDDIILGGTGYDVLSELPPYIDSIQPDYSIYPTVPSDISYGFLTRGCPNKCSWCVVPKKEGHIKPYQDIEYVANGNRKVVLMDNNILAAGNYCLEQLQKIIDLNLRVDFNQALDARLVNDDNARLLAKIHWLERRIRFGCDTHKQIEDCQRAIDLINSYGYTSEYFLYTMLHGDINECYERLSYWRIQLIKYRKHLTGGVRLILTHNHIVIHTVRILSLNGKKTWQDGVTKRCASGRSILRSTNHEKDLYATGISIIAKPNKISQYGIN